MNVRENVPISELTTMRLGGAARYVIEIDKVDDIEAAYGFASEHDLPVFVLGGGTNTIGRDDGYSGVILLNRLSGIEIIKEDSTKTIIECASGELLDDLVGFSVDHKLTGIEAMSAIPGTVGGAVFQNSGAYGQDLSQVLASVSAYDSIEKRFIELNRNDLELTYRETIFSGSARGRYFITAIRIELKTGEIAGDLYKSLRTYLDKHNINERSSAIIREAVTAIRTDKLPNPTVEPSAGSFFHNVVIDEARAAELLASYPDAPIFDMNGQKVIASGWLLEQCGFKGKTLHGIRSSDKAALVLINDSAKNYADLAAARAEIKHAVREKFGLELEQEPEEI